MEEVWNDINLASLHAHPIDFRGLNLQDFLARTCTNKDSVQSSSVSSGFASPTPLPPTTRLTLNSRPERLHFSGNSDPLNLSFNSLPQNLTISPACCVNKASEGHGKKRFIEPDSNLAGDRRYKRMIKNRESAARSRARKQAYTNELELEVAHLMEENARLREQQQLNLAEVAQVPTKQTLRRTSTAPF